MIIYKITNKINGKVYIGQTTLTINRRWYYHCYKSSGCTFLHRAIEKYGAENFTIEQVDAANNKFELDQKEQFWIQHYNSLTPNGYNLKTGGATPLYSEESKKQMSVNHADVSGENNPRFGVQLTAATKKKISDSHKGKRLSDEHKEKCRLSSPKRKVVKNLDTGEVFVSCKLAEKTYGLSNCAIQKVCSGKGISAGGYRWCYL